MIWVNGVPRGGAYNSATVEYYRSGGRAREGNRRSDVRDYIGFPVNGVIRTSSYERTSNRMRSAYRQYYTRGTASNGIGFRLCV